MFYCFERAPAEGVPKASYDVRLRLDYICGSFTIIDTIKYYHYHYYYYYYYYYCSHLCVYIYIYAYIYIYI